jgi:hypothetical protein
MPIYNRKPLKESDNFFEQMSSRALLFKNDEENTVLLHGLLIT